ncbi:catalase-related peroxidase [Colletotrichum spaethianum]|uniref:Catalase-related peroxidase n=1 Tax=Colletotrichum spaethianum TaxID=700344 RepID=A0AA37PDJ6_9PEZI|nr:catalase-related peroxidase [Colletotrichum spaethianum]GKT50242.1 catalase-related peroxidase [Colletotrichum spaethianum]
MPLPTDNKVVETSQGLVDVLHNIFGPHPGFRPAHAKGVLLRGVFRPTDTAARLSRAQHFTNPETPAIARFSSSTGIPNLPDTDPNGNPRGLAVRFQLADSPLRVHTDIVAHSTPFFPAPNGEEALAFFQSVANGDVADYVASHPAALAFVQAPKPFPASFGRETYYSVNAFKLIAADGTGTFVRYRWVPVRGEMYLEGGEVRSKSPRFLFDGVSEVLRHGPIEFKLLVQVAEDGDVTDDNTVHWPEERQVLELGQLSLTELVDNDAAEQKNIIFDPVPRVDGVEPSADPLLEVRAGVYLISGRERRQAST